MRKCNSGIQQLLWDRTFVPLRPVAGEGLHRRWEGRSRYQVDVKRDVVVRFRQRLYLQSSRADTTFAIEQPTDWGSVVVSLLPIFVVLVSRIRGVVKSMLRENNRERRRLERWDLASSGKIGASFVVSNGVWTSSSVELLCTCTVTSFDDLNID